jgi:hypothetical protein
MCDSGDAYGRNFNKYKNAPNFNEGLIFESDYAVIPVHVFMDKNLVRSDAAVEIEKMIGFFLNILVLRSKINGNLARRNSR